MKTLKEIATIILERRQRMNPTVMQGEMTTVLGEDGLQEALNRRWLVPNYESGYLQVANHGSVVEDMQAIAAMPDPTPEPDKLGESRTICTQHAFRTARPLEEASVISEIAAPGTGRPAPGFVQSPAASTPTAPAQAPQPGAPGAAPLNIGDDASVVENGKTYQGKVQASENGRFKISFGGPERPSRLDYAPNELSRVVPAQ